jgi:calcium/calmodulin-dependent protein kinase I
MTSVEHIRTRVYELIEKHEPNKVDSVDDLMKKWRGKENELLKTLCERFKEKHEKMAPVQIKKVFSIGSKLGTGGFAVVRKCKRRKDGVVFALKVINKKNLDKDDLVILESEVNIMRQVSHPNIVKLHDVFDSRSKMCLVLDLLEGGELFDRIIEKGHFRESDAANCFAQMVLALKYLHDKQIVHRDLKPENLLFATKANDSAIKLIDFGLAGSIKDGLLKTPCGTPNYVAPEILRRQKYGVQADMWSIGVILYIILCGFPPFYDENDDLGRLYRKIKRADYDMPSPYWDNITPDAKDLVKKTASA